MHLACLLILPSLMAPCALIGLISCVCPGADPDAAESAIRLHLTRVFDTVRKLIAAHGDYFDPEDLAQLDRYAGMAEAPSLAPAGV